MKLGLYGRPGSGRRTVFEALSQGLKGQEDAAKGRQLGRLAVVQVPDERLQPLTAIFGPKKTTPARLTIIMPDETAGPSQMLAQLAATDGLIFVVRNFTDLAGRPPRPDEELKDLEEDLILRDLSVAEGRLERVKKGRAKGQEALPDEEKLLSQTIDRLNSGLPLRGVEELSQAEVFKSFAFLSAKARLVIINNAEEDFEAPPLTARPKEVLVLQGEIEKELARLEGEEAAQLRAAYGLEEPVFDRLARAGLDILGLITFFTVGPEEVRAWTLPRGSDALKAAGTVHSDMARGFIRAEVVPAGDLIAAGSMAQARQQGLIRLEGKDHLINDGDVVTIRFNV